MSKIKSTGNQAFNVPATEEGKLFLKLAKKFINRPNCSFRTRGRGKRYGQVYGRTYQGYLPQSMSSWFAMYVTNKPMEKRYNTALGKQYEYESKIHRLDDKINELVLNKEQPKYIPVQVKQEIVTPAPATYRMPEKHITPEKEVTEVIITVKGTNVRIERA